VEIVELRGAGATVSSVVGFEQLAGGMGNGGRVVRIGDTVRRPVGAFETATSALLRELAASDFRAPVQIGADAQGRSCFGWIDGEVPVPPYPAWSLTDSALAGVGRLLRHYHDAARGVRLQPGLDWCQELADPRGGPIICHNDVCPENVVFHDHEAIALLDFDFAAPGRPVWDLAQTARMWIPLRPAQFNGDRAHLDPLKRLRVLADAYELLPAERRELVDAIVESRRLASRFVQHRVQAGEPAFVEAWKRHGMEAGDAAILTWLEQNRNAFLAALAAD
jgi:Phosphotransferase enzyme family